MDSWHMSKRPRTDVSNMPTSSVSLSPPRQSPPVHFLADELLSQIFTLATHASCDRYDAILYPIIISHVTSRWRQIALSTSSLWTSIILTHPSPWSQLWRTAEYLTRSRKRPLDLFLDFRDPSWNWQEDLHTFRWKHMENVMRLLCPHVSRWRNLELFTDTWSPIFTFLWYLRKVQSAPMLESLSLSRCNVYFAAQGEVFQPTALRQPIPLFGGGDGLKRLRKVVLAGVHVDWSNSGLRDLIELELKYHAKDVMPSLGQFITILTGCPHLERLTILGWGPRFETETSVGNLSGPIRLARLKHFVLGFLDVEYAIELLSLFSFPDLKTLILEDISATLQPTDRQDANPILEFLAARHTSMCSSSSHSSSCCTTRCFPLSDIRTLELRAVHASEPILSHFLHKFTSLRGLSITNMDGTIFAVLDRQSEGHNTSGSLCPALTDVICKKVDFDALVDLIGSRKGIHRITSTNNLSLDIRGEDLTAEHRATFVNAGLTLLDEIVRPRRPSLLLLPQYQEGGTPGFPNELVPETKARMP